MSLRPFLLRLLVGLLLASAPGAPQLASPDAPKALTDSPEIQQIDKLAAALTSQRLQQIERIHSQSEAQARQREVRAAMLRLIGPLPERTPLNPVILGETLLPGIRMQKILFDSQPGFHVTALLYLPDSPSTAHALPAILMSPGHAPGGKASDFVIASALARNGFAVLSYDPLGQGERLQYPDPHDPANSLAGAPTGEHGEASLQPILLGESVAKYFLWDAMRGLDYLESRPEIDRNRLGAFGCSGGGAITALLGAVEPRLHAIGTACYITTWDALLASLGPQDAEQSTPGWLAGARGLFADQPSRRLPAGALPLDFADYVEAAAPTPYAIISTTEDMFPFAGAQATAAEAQKFYARFSEAPATAAGQSLVFITGPGRHAHLIPILPRILKFFIDALQSNPFPPIYDDQSPAVQVPAGTLQVTPTGQVSTFDPHAQTVFSLNLRHARTLPPPRPQALSQLQQSVRNVIGLPTPQRGPLRRAFREDRDSRDFGGPLYESRGVSAPVMATPVPEPAAAESWLVAIPRADGTVMKANLSVPRSLGSQPVPLDLFLRGDSDDYWAADLKALQAAGHATLSLAPQPVSPGRTETKSTLLGSWYLPALRFMLVDRTLLGDRVSDTLLALDYLEGLRLPHLPGVAAHGSGHMAIVLLHAAVLDSQEPGRGNQPERLEHIELRGLPESYADLTADPLPRDISQDVLPSVLLHYDLPNLIAALGKRVEVAPVVRPDNPVP